MSRRRPDGASNCHERAPTTWIESGRTRKSRKTVVSAVTTSNHFCWAVAPAEVMTQHMAKTDKRDTLDQNKKGERGFPLSFIIRFGRNVRPLQPRP